MIMKTQIQQKVTKTLLPNKGAWFHLLHQNRFFLISLFHLDTKGPRTHSTTIFFFFLMQIICHLLSFSNSNDMKAIGTVDFYNEDNIIMF